MTGEEQIRVGLSGGEEAAGGEGDARIRTDETDLTHPFVDRLRWGSRWGSGVWQEYDDFVEEMMGALAARYPEVLIQVGGRGDKGHEKRWG